MQVELWMWGALGALVLVCLLVDLVAFGRRKGTIRFREAVAWSIGWTVLGLVFGALIWLREGRVYGEEYLAGFLIEKSLSVDNLFVFALIFAYFAVPAAAQRRVIFWGIVGAIVLRGLFIAGGAALLDAFHHTIYGFGAFLVFTGIRMVRNAETEIDPEHNVALRLLRRLVPVTTELEGDRLLVRRNDRRFATPLFAALVLVAAFDVVFAVDSIPAIFAVTEETFIVYAANAFSLLGLAALYFTLSGMLDRFHYLHLGLAAILVFVGAKMLLSDAVKIPAFASLAVIVLLLAASVVASILRPPEHEEPTPSAGPVRAPEAAVAAVETARRGERATP